MALKIMGYARVRLLSTFPSIRLEHKVSAFGGFDRTPGLLIDFTAAAASCFFPQRSPVTAAAPSAMAEEYDACDGEGDGSHGWMMQIRGDVKIAVKWRRAAQSISSSAVVPFAFTVLLWFLN